MCVEAILLLQPNCKGAVNLSLFFLLVDPKKKKKKKRKKKKCRQARKWSHGDVGPLIKQKRKRTKLTK